MNSASAGTPVSGQQLSRNQPPGPPPQFDLASPGDNTTITFPNGQTIPVKPGGQYVVPRGSVVTQGGVQILNDKTNRNGFVMKDGTDIRAVDEDKVSRN